jgi:MATE family multidrug resistance protein
VQNLRGFTEAQMRPWLPLGNILLGVGLNVLFNYGLIYGNFGLPALGLPGAALGTLLARCAMLLHFIWVLRRNREVRPTAGAWRPVPWRSGFYGEYLHLALPSAAMIVVWIGSNVVVAVLMGRIGPAALAAHEIVRQLSALLFTLSVAFQAAIAIRVAQAAGLNDTLGVRRVAWSSIFAILAAMSTVGTVVFVLRHEVPRWFVGAKGEGHLVSALSARLLAVVAFGVVADAVILACVGVFRGLATVRVAAVIYLVGAWVVGLPLASMLGFKLGGGAVGIWQGVVCANWLAAVVLAGLLARTLLRPQGSDGSIAGTHARSGSQPYVSAPSCKPLT